MDVEKLFAELETLAKKYDAGAIVIDAGETKATPDGAALAQRATFVIIVAPNNFKLKDALHGFCLSKDNEVELVNSEVDLQASTRLDYLSVVANIYYKGTTYDSK